MEELAAECDSSCSSWEYSGVGGVGGVRGEEERTTDLRLSCFIQAAIIRGCGVSVIDSTT
jgi:hypothetical protein